MFLLWAGTESGKIVSSSQGLIFRGLLSDASSKLRKYPVPTSEHFGSTWLGSWVSQLFFTAL